MTESVSSLSSYYPGGPDLGPGIHGPLHDARRATADWGADPSRRTWLVASARALFSEMTASAGSRAGFRSCSAPGLVGEASTNPASQAIIADICPSRERCGAMTVFALGPTSG
jgi:hypothetical protein